MDKRDKEDGGTEADFHLGEEEQGRSVFGTKTRIGGTWQMDPLMVSRKLHVGMS